MMMDTTLLQKLSKKEGREGKLRALTPGTGEEGPSPYSGFKSKIRIQVIPGLTLKKYVIR
jgi:hypothetical protein